MQVAGTYLSRTLSDVFFFNSIYIPAYKDTDAVTHYHHYRMRL